MLSTRTNSKSPTLIGPMFVHVKKDFTTYHFFSSSLIGQQPNLVNLQAFGTDGETALANALSASFPNAVHVRCFLHFKGNIEHKLNELKIPASIAKEFVEDIMGKPTRFQLGLVDAKDFTHLDEMLAKIEPVWNEREKPFNSNPVFFSWFYHYQRNVIAESMIQEVRIKAKLGNPPAPYYTSEVESKNNILKQHVHYKASELPKFVDSMKDLFQQQRKEIERAVLDQGEYRLRSEYQSYGVQCAKWFTLTADQRSKRLDKFMKADLSVPNLMSSVKPSTSEYSCPLNQLSLPGHFSTDVWNKANRLSQSSDGMVQCPGDKSSWLVKSESSNRPHFVRSAKCGGYLCDEECLAYKSTKMCAHTIAVAIKTGSVEEYLKWYKTKKGSGPNFTALAEARKPKSAGKKRKGVTKKSAKKIKSIVSNADESVWEYPHSNLGTSDDEAHDDDSGTQSQLLSSEFPTYNVQPGSASNSSVSMSVMSSSRKSDSHFNIAAQDPITFQPVNTGTLQVNYSNVQIAGPPPLVKSTDNCQSLPLFPPHTLCSISASSVPLPPAPLYSSSDLPPHSQEEYSSLPSSMSPPHLQSSSSVPSPDAQSYHSVSQPVQWSSSVPPPLTKASSSVPLYSQWSSSVPPPHAPHTPYSSSVPLTLAQYSISPPLLSQQQEPRVETPFWITLLFGNVSRCNGCRGRIARAPDNKPLPPPDNLVLGHKEYVIYNNARTGRFEQSRDKRNIYYHPWKTCIAPNFVDFDPCRHLLVSNDVKDKLHPSHTKLLETEFGVKLV